MIKIGTSGFSFDDWKGAIYPPGIKKNNWLEFYEQELGFKALEINFTYYRLPSPKSFESMSRKTSTNFEFVVKAYQDMTHNIRDKTTKKIIDTSEVFKKFIFSLDPLIQDNKLSCVLMQFPYSFNLARENVDYLRKIKDLMGDIHIVVEFRNSGWLHNNTFNFLRENGMGYCVVDEPKLKGLMPFAPNVTSDIGYIRFHGRNKNWFNSPLSVRYNYYYSKDELKEFVEPVRKLGLRAAKLLVFFNNCHAGHAAKNAIMFSKMLLEGTLG